MPNHSGFIQTVFLSGVFLIALPLLHHLYVVHAVSHMVEAMHTPNFSVDMPPAPTEFYIVSAATGALLLVISLVLHLRAAQAD
ncbi:hypothetical protein [Massilia sp. TS11]|uniref:hypothetical protein n=1 Tax=Massilia sp. TS11 TaxID=2908003 RepID=UPI001EDAD843|nr:hypothetical protein [Massilia sp. TS11]MCG2582896.1 hypothetical protein [Massilia sp. TS11]